MILDLQSCIDCISYIIRSVVPLSFIWGLVHIGFTAIVKAATGKFKSGL